MQDKTFWFWLLWKGSPINTRYVLYLGVPNPQLYNHIAHNLIVCQCNIFVIIAWNYLANLARGVNPTFRYSNALGSFVTARADDAQSGSLEWKKYPLLYQGMHFKTSEKGNIFYPFFHFKIEYLISLKILQSWFREVHLLLISIFWTQSPHTTALRNPCRGQDINFQKFERFSLPQVQDRVPVGQKLCQIQKSPNRMWSFWTSDLNILFMTQLTIIDWNHSISRPEKNHLGWQILEMNRFQRKEIAKLIA